jgi:hypothetical protein
MKNEMDDTWKKRKIHTKFWLKHLKGKYHFGDAGVEEGQYLNVKEIWCEGVWHDSFGSEQNPLL